MSVKKIVVMVVIMVLLFAVAIASINRMVSVGDEGEIRMIKDAVKNAMLTCFAVEGAFPRELEYLEENYGLNYDKEKYSVRYDYDPEFSNLMPEIWVTVMGDGRI